MSEPRFTRPALWEDVIDLARRLNRHGARYVLVGGYALAAHGLVRMTTDIDIAVAPDPDNNRRWVAALAETGPSAGSKRWHRYSIARKPRQRPAPSRYSNIFA